MQDLLLSLPIGVVLITLVFITLRRGWKLPTVTIAVGLVVGVMGLLGIIGALAWPGLDVFAMLLAVYLLTIYINALLWQTSATASETTPRRHWAPLLLISFFGFVIAINLLFLVLADVGTDSIIGRWLLPSKHPGEVVSSIFPGTVAHDYREKEDQFNQYQQLRDQQRVVGWKLHYGWKVSPLENTLARFELNLRDKNAQPVRADKIQGVFYFPGDARLDTSFTMQAVADGNYQAELRLPHAGRWDLVLLIQRGTDQHEVRASTDVGKLQAP
ncbi:MAG: FixH family protein [Gammaproteobacteria bacterium]|nr:FixH family protein [Gammaproteobacteria bacterium]